MRRKGNLWVVRVLRYLILVLVLVYGALYVILAILGEFESSVEMARRMALVHLLALLVDLGVLVGFVWKGMRPLPPQSRWGRVFPALFVVGSLWRRGETWGMVRTLAIHAVAENDTRRRLLARAQTEAPEVFEGVARLLRRWRTDEARRLLELALRTKAQEGQRRARIRAAAARHSISSAVEPLLELCEWKSAEHLVERARSILADADSLGVKEEAARSLDQGDVDGAIALMYSARMTAELERARTAYTSRIRELPLQYQSELRELLDAALTCEFGSRFFRKGLYTLQRRLNELECIERRH
jgi:hypothetical protein